MADPIYREKLPKTTAELLQQQHPTTDTFTQNGGCL